MKIEGVELSSPDKVLFADAGITKAELAQYLVAVADHLLPEIAGRALSLVRCPDGDTEHCFYQKHDSKGLPNAIDVVRAPEKDGEALYLAVSDNAGLAALAQIGTLEIHPWLSRADRPDRPDRIVFDLDPGPGISFHELKDAAIELRELLTGRDLQSFVRTTGGKGLHVVLPIERRQDFAQTKAFARTIAGELSETSPNRFTDNARKEKREGRIFIDYLRNARGATAIASYSPRAKPDASVATPLRWEELSGLAGSEDYTIANIRQRLGSLANDPWEDFHRIRQRL